MHYDEAEINRILAQAIEENLPLPPDVWEAVFGDRSGEETATPERPLPPDVLAEVHAIFESAGGSLDASVPEQARKLCRVIQLLGTARREAGARGCGGDGPCG